MSHRPTDNSQTLAERVRERRLELGYSEAALSSAAGLGKTYVRDLEKKEVASPRSNHLARLASVLGVHPEWLRAGQGPRLIDDDATHAAEAVGRMALLPVLDATLSAGGGALVDREDAKEWWPVPRALLDELGIAAAEADVLHVRGDSMEPTLKNGAVVIVDRTDRTPLTGIYALWDGSGLVVKRVQRLGSPSGSAAQRVSDAAGVLRLISDNPAYPPYELPLADLIVVGRVGAVVNRL